MFLREIHNRGDEHRGRGDCGEHAVLADGVDDEELEIDKPGGEEESTGGCDGDETEVIVFFCFEDDVYAKEDGEVVERAEESDRNAHD